MSFQRTDVVSHPQVDWPIFFKTNGITNTGLVPPRLVFSTYTLQAGDCLSKVAAKIFKEYQLIDEEKYFSAADVLSALQKLNQGVKLLVGTTITVPAYTPIKTPIVPLASASFDPAFKERSRQITIGETQNSTTFFTLIKDAIASGFNTFIIDLKDESGTINQTDLAKIYRLLKQKYPDIKIHYRIVCQRDGADVIIPGSAADRPNQKSILALLQQYQGFADGFVFDYIRYPEKLSALNVNDTSRINVVNAQAKTYFDVLKKFRGQVRFCLFGVTAGLSDKITIAKLGQDPLSLIKLGQESGLHFGFMIMSYASHYGTAYAFPAANLGYAQQYVKKYPLKNTCVFTEKNPPVENPEEINALTIAPLRKYLEDHAIKNVGLYTCILGNNYGLGSAGLTAGYLAGQYQVAEEIGNGYYLFNVKEKTVVNLACAAYTKKIQDDNTRLFFARYQLRQSEMFPLFPNGAQS